MRLAVDVPRVTCSMRPAIPSPCIGPRLTAFRISKSSVPCNRSVCSPQGLLLLVFYISLGLALIECQYERDLAIRHVVGSRANLKENGVTPSRSRSGSS